MTPFAALILDRDPYLFADFPGLLQAWFQDAGGFLYAGLMFFLIVSITRPQAVPRDGGKKGISPLPLVCWAVATLLYAAYILLVLSGGQKPLQAFGVDLLNVKPLPDPNGYVKVVSPKLSLFGYKYGEIPGYLQPFVQLPENATPQAPAPYPWQALLLTVGGLASFVGAVVPVAGNVAKLRLRRIWAMALLCMKEGLRNRLFIACLVIMLPLMVPLNWFFPPKPEDDLRDAVQWVARITAFPLVFLAVLIAAYALPNDVKNQNIYTIVTKPIERFEIVLGRFLGYAVLLSGVVAGVGLFTLLTILGSGPREESKRETGIARVPVRGELSFQSRKLDFVGTDVGREFNYRKHIGGSPLSSQRAVYSFPDVNSSLATADRPIPLEFNFDIYRLTKGDENKGVFINVRVVSWQRDQAPPAEGEQTGEWRWGRMKSDGKGFVFNPDKAEAEYRRDAVTELRKVPEYAERLAGPEDQAQTVAVQLLASSTPDSPSWPAANTLAEKYGFFEFRGKEVFDFHPERIFIPPGLFKNAAASDAPEVKDPSGRPVGDAKAHEGKRPRLQVYVHCTSASQMLGMAEGDLYILQAEESFAWNHLKSQLGLWCWLLLVVGLAVTLSTYLDFIVTLVAVLFLFGAGFAAPYINELGVTSGTEGGQGGPLRALNQLVQAKQSTALPTETTVEKSAEAGDVVLGWGFRRVVNFLPDVYAFEWTNYVAEGFSVPGEGMVMNLVVLLAYLFPWFLMSYYLIRGREVAA
jgi:ABC-type transport system involved in multi-copper enzyme maturation permease subunit